MLPQRSDVYCSWIFVVFLIKHTVFMAKNLLVVTFFTQAKKQNAQNEAKLIKKICLDLIG